MSARQGPDPPPPVIRLLGAFNPLIGELPTTMYRFQMPFVIDDSATREGVGLEPTPSRDALAAAIASYR